MRLSPAPAITKSGVYPELLSLMQLPYAPGIGNSGWLKTAVLPDGVHEILLEDFSFRWNGRTIIVPRGFVTDYASVPRFFHRILPQRGKYSPAALVHDYLYWSGIMSKGESDLVLRELSRRLDVGVFDRWALWLGVLLGGGPTWNCYRNG